MRRQGWKRMMIEAWAFIAVAAIAFVGGLLIGDLGSSPKTETVLVAAPSESEEVEATEGEAAEGEVALTPSDVVAQLGDAVLELTARRKVEKKD